MIEPKDATRDSRQYSCLCGRSRRCKAAILRWPIWSAGLLTRHRMLARMSHLNDVEVDGRTHFAQDDLDVRRECAKTLIWPAERMRQLPKARKPATNSSGHLPEPQFRLTPIGNDCSTLF